MSWPSSTMVAPGGETMRMKSKLYLSGVRNTYEERNCSTGGITSRLGSPPGSPRGMPAASWLGDTLDSIIGESLSSMKSRVVVMSAKSPRPPRVISAFSPPSVVVILAPASVAAITRKYSG